MTTVTDGLNGLAADAMVMYQKLHHYHWNIAGDEFFSLHIKFEELYNYFSVVLDDVAERVLTVGGTPPRTLGEVLEKASIEEDPGLPADDEDFVKNIMNDFNALLASSLVVVEAAEAARDRGTVTLLDDFRTQLEKHVWMLRSYLKD